VTGHALDPVDLQKAAELCKLAGAPDLLTWLGMGRGAAPAELHEALSARRKHMQAMQANPKYARLARALLTSFKNIERVLASPSAYLDEVERQAEAARLPLLAIAIDSVLADGEVSETEEEFVHKQAQLLGITPVTVRRMMLDRAKSLGIDLTSVRGPTTEVADTPSVPGADGYPWWDAGFARLLRELVPSSAAVIVDGYCRTAMSATTLLPERPKARWFGYDRRPDRLDAAARVLGNYERVLLRTAGPERYPLEDGSADVLLLVRALSTEASIFAAIDEARRVLRPGGMFIVAEADGLAETFFFDGHLVGFNQAFHALMARLDLADGPTADRGGPSLGPRLAAVCEHRGFSVSKTMVHAAHVLKSRRFERFARSLRRYPAQIASAGGLPIDCAEVRAVAAEVDRLSYRVAGDAVGLSGTVLPLWVVVARRE
jgi:SAM-dependent methyltransferase